jgi:CheY-like chemotaxis protein
MPPDPGTILGPSTLLRSGNPWGLAVDDPRSTDDLANFRILVAEDEGLIALDIEDILQRFGCTVVGPFSDVEDVITAARTTHLDGALLDVNLRGQQVFGILPELLALGLPIVLTSGYDDDTLFPVPFQALPRLTKPFNERALHQICMRAMARAAPRYECQHGQTPAAVGDDTDMSLLPAPRTRVS